MAACENDERFMMLALDQADLAAARGEVPVGAILISAEAEILASAHNAPISTCDPTAHAEILCLRAAASALGNYRLPGATLYVSVEPCLMCVGAIVHARLARVVFGCFEPKTGALGSVYDIPSAGVANHSFETTSGVCADASAQRLRSFFSARRGA